MFVHCPNADVSVKPLGLDIRVFLLERATRWTDIYYFRGFHAPALAFVEGELAQRGGLRSFRGNCAVVVRRHAGLCAISFSLERDGS